MFFLFIHVTNRVVAPVHPHFQSMTLTVSGVWYTVQPEGGSKGITTTRELVGELTLAEEGELRLGVQTRR